MKKLLYIALFIFMPMSVSAQEDMSELNHGSNVHQNHCLKCHDESIYTREDRIVKSMTALGKQVRICRDNTQAPWFAEDTDAVINFLNQKYYRF